MVKCSKTWKLRGLSLPTAAPEAFSCRSGLEIPIVVPRQSAFSEHVNDHQLEFVRAMERRQGNILIVEDVGLLKNTLLNYETIVQSMSAVLHPNNEQFLLAFGSIVDELFHVSTWKDALSRYLKEIEG